MAVLLAAVLVAVSAWWVLLPVFQLRPPGGPHGIGTLTYNVVDSSRHEAFSTDPARRRELVVQVWYPASPAPSAPHALYLPDADGVTSALARLRRLPWFTLRRLRDVDSHAVHGAPVSAGEQRYPVLVFLEGLNGFRQMNMFQVEHLVSHGYVVAAVDQPYIAAMVVFADGRRVAGLAKDQMNGLIQQSIAPAARAPTLNGRRFSAGIVPYFAEDARFALACLAGLDRADPNAILTGRLDVARAGILGVSLGGIVAAEACRLEPRFRACVVMDAPMPVRVAESGLRQPVMWITRDARTMQREGWPQLDVDQHQRTMRSAFGHLRGAGYFVQVAGMYHANLTDLPYWSPALPALGITGPMEWSRAHDIVNAYTLACFDRHLKQVASPLLDGRASRFPEVLFEARRR